MHSIKSDYLDCYDAWFESPQPGIPAFSRMAQHSWSIRRQDMFRAFERLGIPTPQWGPVGVFEPTELVVVYTDELAHCGEGKELGRAGTFESALLASKYVDDYPSVSYRYFSICGVGAWFKHYSVDDWRSNCGDGDLEEMPPDIATVHIDRALEGTILNPVYAIDFVARKSTQGDQLLAIDFNPAPKLAGTPARAIIDGHFGGSRGVAQAISSWVTNLTGSLDYDNNHIHLE